LDPSGGEEAKGGRVLVCIGGPATRGPGGITVEEESELYDFEEQAAKTYIDELSTTVRTERSQIEVFLRLLTSQSKETPFLFRLNIAVTERQAGTNLELPCDVLFSLIFTDYPLEDNQRQIH
jgi:hypothetical protein